MLFNNNKKDKSVQLRLDALALLAEALENLSSSQDKAYCDGLIEMAYTLGILTMHERSIYKEAAYKKEQEEKAKGEPVYKKKGVYEYNGYYILKDLSIENSNACWCVKQIGADVVIVKGLKFKDAAKHIDEITKGEAK